MQLCISLHDLHIPSEETIRICIKIVDLSLSYGIDNVLYRPSFLSEDCLILYK